MADKVIRKDVIEVEVKSDGKELDKLNDGIEKLKKSVNGGVDDGLDKIKKSVDGVGKSDGLNKVKKGAEKMKQSLDKGGSSATKLTSKLVTLGKKAGGVAYKGLKKLAGISFKTVAAGITAVASALGGLVAKSVSAYGDYQQLVGGVETLFGAGGAKSVQEYAKLVNKPVSKVQEKYKALKETETKMLNNANEAYKTAGLSANQYMETATSFSASLVQSLKGDTVKAANYTQRAVVDMADNANKMGTDIGMIQNAYQGFAKENYTMLDNLKLGYGGTKKEMERLIIDASKMKDVQKKLGVTVDASSSSFANIVNAISVMQESMGIAGTTQKEAMFTISGSVNTFKAAWGNLMPALIQGGDEFDRSLNNFIDSIIGFEDKTGKRVGGLISNLKPAIIKSVGGIGKLIEEATPMIEKGLPKLVDELLPPLIKAAVMLFAGLIKALPNIIEAIKAQIPFIVKTLYDAIVEAFPSVKKIGDKITEKATIVKNYFTDNAEKIKNGVKIAAVVIGGAFAAFKIGKGVSSVIGFFDKFKGAKGADDKGSMFSGIINIFKELAKAKTATILKGMVNLTIIIAGITLLTALFLKVAPSIAQLGDAKSFLKVVLLVGVLGIVGTALAKCAGIVGNIPVATVAKGLANIAIVLVGLGALLFVATKVFQQDINFMQMIKVISLIGILGVVGSVLAVFAGIAGLIPIPIVVKGLANIAIVLVGIGALLLAITKVFENGVNFAQIFIVISLMGILGTVGSVLTVFAGIVGLIPIPVVLAGLTNLGLVLGGITVLIEAFGALSKIPGFNEFLDTGGKVLVKIMNILGEMIGSLVGGVMDGIAKVLPSVGESLGKFGENIKPLFAAMKGIDMKGVGAFFTALVSLLGIATANDIIQGIKEFFGGKSESPLIGLGRDLTSFAGAAKGFFQTAAALPKNSFLNGKSMFDCLKNIKNIPKESINLNYTKLADGLAQLGGSKVVNFFNTISKIKIESFKIASAFFKCLATMKSLPSEGGVKGWINGNINYTKLVDGLAQLGSQKVVDFFNTISKIKIESFKIASAFFKCLATMKSLPSEGGVKGWFSGSIDYTSIADGLTVLGKEGIVNFFKMLSGVPVDTFGKVKKLLGFLAEIERFNKNSAFGKQSKSKKETESRLSILAKDLTTFAINAQEFLLFINSLNVDNLLLLISAIKDLSSATTNLNTDFSNISKKIKSTFSNSQKVVKDSLKSIASNIRNTDLSSGGVAMMNSLTRGINSRASAVVSAVSAITDSIKGKINSVINGANWALGQFGSNKKLSTYSYANGTNGHKGGNALVNDGRGAELLQMPNGNTFIPSGKNVFMPNAPKGMKVLPAEETARLMGRRSPTFNYKKGVGDIDVWDYVDDTSGLVNKLNQKYVSYKGLKKGGLHLARGGVSTASSSEKTYFKKSMDEFGALSLASYNASKGVEQWRTTVIRALKMEGHYSEANVKRTLYQMQTESGGNPRAINLWDSNAKKGIPSKGLMQVIDPTFRAYARAGFNKNIYDPLSNILASIRYAVSRYGSLAKAYRGHGYANGGFANRPSIFGEDGLEAAIPLSKDKRKQGINLWKQTGSMLGLPTYTPERDTGVYNNTSNTENNTYAPTFNLTVSGTNDDRTTARKVKRWVNEAFEEMFDSYERKNPKLREV